MTCRLSDSIGTPPSAAMSNGARELVQRFEREREIDDPRREPIPDLAETLERIRGFLQAHETSAVEDCTHGVFDCYQDWWCGENCSFMLAIAEHNTLDLLHGYAAALHDLGVPLTLVEKKSQEIRLVLDVQVLGSESARLSAEDLLSPEKPFARLLGETMGEVFPGELLDCLVFDSSGPSRADGVMKTSLRLVWPSIVVDKERALRVRDYLLVRFKDSRDEEIVAMGATMQQLNKKNAWGAVFNDAIYSYSSLQRGVRPGIRMPLHGIRMPLCDRVSPAPMKRRELRPSRPFGCLRFSFPEGALGEIEMVTQPDDLTSREWLRRGCIRCDMGTPLTEWSPPTVGGRLRMEQGAMSASMPRTPGRVNNPRTRGGSEHPLRRARPRANVQLVTHVPSAFFAPSAVYAPRVAYVQG
mmetsp:Transcript_14185/g.30725  ORF Transcript_14185/g.30725 Transcript_14185/m.30725 type:complete len:413 (+) Transcript_14185:1-1239(+)